MVGFNKKDEDMSMEDILSSIRKYVSEEDISKSNKFTSSPNVFPQGNNTQQDNINNEKVINLDASNVFPQENNDTITSSNVESDPLQNYDIDNLTKSTNNNTFSKNNNGPSNNIEDIINNNTNVSGQNSPFNKLAEALKSYGKQKKSKTSELSYNMTVNQFLRTIVESYVQKWMDENLKKIVEQIVLKEVEKLKSEN